MKFKLLVPEEIKVGDWYLDCSKISLDEILPTAHRYGHAHSVISGIMLGFFVMAVSLIIL